MLLAPVVGAHAAKVVKFYVDPAIAIKNADDYSHSLERMFGEGAKILVNSISDKLCEIARVKRREWSSLGECVQTVKELYSRERTISKPELEPRPFGYTSNNSGLP